VMGGGHLPPAKEAERSSFLVRKMLGSQNHDIDAAETIWAFFKANMR